MSTTPMSNAARKMRRLHLVEPMKDELIGEYLARWLAGRRALRPATVRSYEGHIRRYLGPHLGHIALSVVSSADINCMYDELLSKTQLSNATVARINATLMSALNAAVRAGLIEKNPAELVELPPATRSPQATWSPQELMQFLDGAIDHEHHALFALLATRGLRRAEALGLRWSDVDLDQGWLRVTRQLEHYNGVVAFGPPKSKAGIRTVAIDEWLARILHLRGCSQRLKGKLNGWCPDDDTLVFTDDMGVPLNPLRVSRSFDKAVAESGLPRIRLHDLRHTSASIGLASGESLLEVSRRLGHSSIAVTGDIYSRISLETATHSARRMSEYLLKGRSS